MGGPIGKTTQGISLPKSTGGPIGKTTPIRCRLVGLVAFRQTVTPAGRTRAATPAGVATTNGQDIPGLKNVINQAGPAFAQRVLQGRVLPMAAP